MKQKIKDRIVSYVKSNYEILDLTKFINGRTYCNARCHLNSVQEAYDKGYKVLLIICVGNNEVFVHFINQDSKGNYVDNTLGWFGKELYDYYLVREVNKSEYRTIWRLLNNTKKSLININSSWIERKLKIIKEDDI